MFDKLTLYIGFIFELCTIYVNYWFCRIKQQSSTYNHFLYWNILCYFSSQKLLPKMHVYTLYCNYCTLKWMFIIKEQNIRYIFIYLYYIAVYRIINSYKLIGKYLLIKWTYSISKLVLVILRRLHVSSLSLLAIEHLIAVNWIYFN